MSVWTRRRTLAALGAAGLGAALGCRSKDPAAGRTSIRFSGYTGNPALYPLFYNTRASDILIVHINPLYREELPTTSSEIVSRINEVSFNAASASWYPRHRCARVVSPFSSER